MRPFSALFPALCLCLCLSQAWCLRPGIPRVTWESEHFHASIDAAKQDRLPYLIALAEECHARLAAFFEYAPPGRIKMIFLDEQDYANGSAYSAQGWVVIYMHSADHTLRGRTRWLPGVMAHEIGHIFTLRKMGDDSRFLGLDLFHSWNGSDGSAFDESLRIRDGDIPPWLAEGLAQYAAGVCGYDTLDSHRRMLLRTAAADGALLTLAEMKAFAWDGRGNELIYAQGYALVTHVYRAFGPRAVNTFLTRANAEGWREAFRSAFGKSAETVYRDWRKSLEQGAQPARRVRDGGFLLPKPPGNYTVESHPAPLAGKAFFFLSSRKNDFGQTDLYLADGQGGSRFVHPSVTSVVPDADGNGALFTAVRFRYSQGEPASDLYAITARTGRIEKLTSGARVVRGCRSGGSVYGLRNGGGRTSILKIVDGQWTTLYTPPDSLEIAGLAPGRTDSTLTLTTVSGFGGDIRELDLSSLELAPLAVSPQDERDPHWSGDTLFFSADYGGSFDIYAQSGMQVTRRTQVPGGAFQPFVKEGRIWHSAYGSGGFRLAAIEPGAAPDAPYIVGLPVPGWKTPAPAEHEAGTLDRTTPGLLAYGVTMGVARSPGFRQAGAEKDSVGSDSEGASGPISYGNGNKAFTGVDLYWLNPSGVFSARARAGLSRPLDYEGGIRLDGSSLELRVNTFLPSIVAGADWTTFDYPELEIQGRKLQYYEAALFAYAGMELRLAEYWSAGAWILGRNDFAYAGSDAEEVGDSNPKPGAAASLQYANLHGGVHGVVTGTSLSLVLEIPPEVSRNTPDQSFDAGLTTYGSMRRRLFYSTALAFRGANIDDSFSRWMFLGVSGYFAIPLGWQLGTRGGTGLYLDHLYPAIGFSATNLPDPYGIRSSTSAMAPVRTRAQEARAGAADVSTRPNAVGRSLVPGKDDFTDMLRRGASREVQFTLALKTLTFLPRAEIWTFGVRYPASSIGRDPVWTVMVSL